MQFRILKIIFLLMVILSVSLSSIAEQPSETLAVMEVSHGVDRKVDKPIPARSWTEDNKVWLARSCIGEAGFFAVDECIAIAWVYAKRSRETGRSFRRIMRKYSAAIKEHEMHRRPWIFGLNINGSKPKAWPQNLSWQKHKTAWLELLSILDRWAMGDVSDRFPSANHYGSRQDARRAYYVTKWRRVAVPAKFRNWFFDSTQEAKYNYKRKRNGRDG